MMEEKVWLQAGEGAIKLEARFYSAGLQSRLGVVICHPHPLYGGDMNNDVVIALQRAFANEGFSTLRFNFRGVGASGGRYGNGVGEVDDLVAACHFMRHRGVEELFGAGYSFGSWILLKGYRRENFKGLVLVAPPLGVLDFSGLQLPSTVPSIIIVGDKDEFCPRSQLERWIGGERSYEQRSQHRLFVIDGENHFFWQSLGRLVELIGSEIKVWAGT